MTRTQEVAPGRLFDPWQFVPSPGQDSSGGPQVLYHSWHFAPGPPRTQEVALDNI